MYERAEAIWDSTDYPHNYSGTVPEPNVTLSPSAYTPPADEASQAVVFVHGWNMSPEGAAIFAETMYKRLWHRGYKGRFAALRWPTFYSSTFDNVPFVGDTVDAYLANYNDSEYRAWKCGKALKQFMESLPAGYTRNLVAHSMGNIVAGSALRDGLTVNNYALLQGAVPAICYDENANLRPSLEERTYAGISVQLWENITPCDDVDAGMRALTYRGQLSGVSGNLINFFLPNDAATKNAWEFNNDKFKPQTFNLGVSGYYYDPARPPAFRLGISFFFEVGRAVASAHEGMAYATYSPTKVVGAEGTTAGAIDGSVNLSDASFGGEEGFDEEHSAEFNRNIQVLGTFYQTLGERLGVLQPQ
jgi:pimeloyl-ACP methyl ester carboxylesterase